MKFIRRNYLMILSFLLVWKFEYVYSRGAWRRAWNTEAQDLLETYLKTTPNCGIAKNVIFMMGDGMGVTSQFAGRVLKGQRKGNPGEEEFLTWERWQNSALVKTYNTDAQVPDSAATATAFLCGRKANIGTIAVVDSVKRGICPSFKNEVTCVGQWATSAGKSVGIVTNSKVTDASPAPIYAHSPERKWEHKSNAPFCKDIARQLIENQPGASINVVLGGGRTKFIPVEHMDVENNSIRGERLDGRDFIKEWISQKENNGDRYQYVWNTKQLRSVDVNSTDYLLGLFSPSRMPFVVDKTPEEEQDPSLAEMTSMAIKLLSKNQNGFFLFVESSNVDIAHHVGRAAAAVEEVLVLDEAVRAAVELTNEKETLIIVTADHSHTMSIAGYPRRGNPIFGKIKSAMDSNDLPYTTLLYAAGPGYRQTRPNLTDVDTEDPHFRQESAVPLKLEPHGGEDVSVFASGPMSHLFRGNFEQSFIAHAMSYAACIGQNKKHCTEPRVGVCSTWLQESYNVKSTATVQYPLKVSYPILVSLILLFYF